MSRLDNSTLMSSPTNLNPCCSTDVTTQYPGATGATGAAGSNGINAYSVITGATFVPAGQPMTVTMSSNLWCSVGQYVFVSDNISQWATIKITSLPAGGTQIIGTAQGMPGEQTSGSISTGVVSPTGITQLVQGGQTTLVAGVKNVTGVSISSATPAICVSLITPGGTRTLFAGYKITAVVTGLGTSGSFTITAIDSAAATLAACTDIVAWHIIN